MRIARRDIPGVVHHLIWRFVDRDWFLADEVERQQYCYWLGKSLRESDWQCISYALMSSHIHIGAVAGEQPLAVWSRRVNAPFALWLNQRRRRLGPLFADRAKDFAMSPTSVGTLISYIHNNPVRAHVVRRPEESTWTSARAYAGLAARPEWLHVDEGLKRAGVNYDELPPSPSRNDLIEMNIDNVARAARKRGAIEVATPESHVVPLVVRRYARIRPDPRRVIELVAEDLELDPAEISSRRRTDIVCFAREVAVHAARMSGVTGAEIAAALGVSQQAVSRITHKVKPDRRCAMICDRLLQEVRFASLV